MALAQFPLKLIDVAHVAPCYAYRDKAPDESLEEHGLRVANELEAAIPAPPPRRLPPSFVSRWLAQLPVPCPPCLGT